MTGRSTKGLLVDQFRTDEVNRQGIIVENQPSGVIVVFLLRAAEDQAATVMQVLTAKLQRCRGVEQFIELNIGFRHTKIPATVDRPVAKSRASSRRIAGGILGAPSAFRLQGDHHEHVIFEISLDRNACSLRNERRILVVVLG